MFTKLIAGLVAVAALTAMAGAGTYFVTGKTVSTSEDCCFPGSPCCVPGAACCPEPVAKATDCCAAGADCCFPGSPCCGDAK